MLDSARSLGYLNGATVAVEEPLPSQECSLAALCEMAKELPLVDDEEQEDCVQPLVSEDGCTSHLDLFSRVTENTADVAAAVTLMGEEYVIPPHTAFLLSDFTRLQPLVHCEYRVVKSESKSCRNQIKAWKYFSGRLIFEDKSCQIVEKCPLLHKRVHTSPKLTTVNNSSMTQCLAVLSETIVVVCQPDIVC